MTKKKIKIILFIALVISGLVMLFPSVSFAGEAADCKPIQSKLHELDACILCPLFEVILKTDQTIATKAFTALAKGFTNLLVVGLAIFIAFHTLILVSSFTKQDAPKYIGTLLMQAFKVMVAVLLLSNQDYVYHYIIDPLMKTGLEFGLALLFNNSDSVINDFKNSIGTYKSRMPSGAIGEELLASVMAAVKAFSNAAADLPAIGGSLICVGTKEGFFKNFDMILQGVLIFGFGWAITLSCCFYILDSVVRFGIFCALLPFLIASWPFKLTSQYTKKGWDIFMNAFFNFVMIGLVITLSSELIAHSLGGGEAGSTDDVRQAIQNAINTNSVENLKNLMDISGKEFLVMIACCMFAFQLVHQINELATQMSGGGGGSPIGSGIGKVAAQAVNKVRKGIQKGGGTVMGAVDEGTGFKAKRQEWKDGAMDKLADVGARIGLGRKASPGGAGGSGGSSGGGSGGS